MSIIIEKNSKKNIPIFYFNVCLFDNKTRKEIGKLYTKNEATTHKTCFYLEKFRYHILKERNITIIEYCEQYLGVEWPRCPICNKKVGFRLNGKDIELSTYATSVNKKHSKKFADSCVRMSKERMGKNNPMFGKTPWNKGLKPEDSASMRSTIEKKTGVPLTNEHKEKLKNARKRHPLKARHITPHTKETRDLLRKIT